MILEQVKHKEFGYEDDFDIDSNRFELFDRNGNHIDTWLLKKEYPNFKQIDVISTTIRSYQSCTYFVGFPVTHIMLDIEDNNILAQGYHSKSLKYGEDEVDNEY